MALRAAAMKRFARARGAVSMLYLAIALGASGCGRSDAIRRYTVPKPAAPARRILAAIVPGQEQTWFFKVAGAPREIEPHVGAFRRFIGSIRWVGSAPARPEWKLPEGWRQQEGSGMHFATLQLGGENNPLELTVTPLPTPEGDPEAYALSNINRWRQQLGLTPIALDELDAQSQQVSLESTTARIVDMVGRRRDGTGRPGATVGPTAPPRAPGQAAEQAAESLRYDTPTDWQPLRAGGMRQAAFRIVDDQQQQAEVTAIALGPQAAALLPNVNRWRRQIKLEPVSQQAMEQQLTPINVDGRSGHFIDLVGPEQATGREAILGAIVADAARSWFFKMRGDAELVARQRDNFQTFVRSVEFIPAE